MSKIVGTIAEDQSDIDVLEEILKKTSKNKPYKIKKFLGFGCGKIIGKCNAWANNLSLQGCTSLIILHDLDAHNFAKLKQDITTAITPSPIANHIVVIAIREIEAWLLADQEAIRIGLNLKKKIKKIPNPESILRPKEYLRDLIFNKSNKEKRYINTVDNKKIASKIQIKNLSRCSSFIDLNLFLTTKVFK